MNLEELREEIDAIDDTLVQAFAQRMDVVARVSQAKKEQGLPTLDPAREREKLADIAAKLPPELEQYGYALWSMLFEISRVLSEINAGYGRKGESYHGDISLYSKDCRAQ